MVWIVATMTNSLYSVHASEVQAGQYEDASKHQGVLVARACVVCETEKEKRQARRRGHAGDVCSGATDELNETTLFPAVIGASHNVPCPGAQPYRAAVVGQSGVKLSYKSRACGFLASITRSHARRRSSWRHTVELACTIDRIQVLRVICTCACE